MLEAILGKKIGMTRIFSEEGEEIPVTVVLAGPCFVVQKKSKDKEGYDAVQLGFLEKKAGKVNKPLKAHFKKAGLPCFYHLKEFRGEGLDEYKPGQKLVCSEIFKDGDFVDVSGRSKGKGFTGVMKRWGFAGGPGSHGSMHNRAPGSIGGSSDPSKVFKGMKMAGHKGNGMTTIQNLRVVGVSPEDNILLLKGAVPGPVNGVVEIRKALKKRQ